MVGSLRSPGLGRGAETNHDSLLTIHYSLRLTTPLLRTATFTPYTSRMARAFDPLTAARKLRDNGMAEPLAEATVEVVQEATGDLVTPEYLDARFDAFEARLLRASWIQSGVIIGGVGVIVALVEALG